MKPVRSFSRSNSVRVPSCFTTCGMRSSTVSYVVNRLLQLVHRLRRRMLSPSSLTRESMTCVSRDLQNGHFIEARNAKHETLNERTVERFYSSFGTSHCH